MLIASPISCRASEIIDTLPVNIPPISSSREKKRLRRKAIKMFFSDFIIPPN
jgi:hypothetical protein